MPPAARPPRGWRAPQRGPQDPRTIQIVSRRAPAACAWHFSGTVGPAARPAQRAARARAPGPVSAGGAGGPPGRAALDQQRHPEAPGQIPLGEHLLQRAGREDGALAQQHRVREVLGHLLDVVRDQDDHRRLRVGGQRGDPPEQVLAAAQVQPGGRLVEQQQLGVGHQRPGDLDPLALALGQGRELPPDQVRAAERVEQFHGAGHVEGVVVLRVAAEDPVRGGQHEVDDLLGRRYLVGDRRAGQPDPGPQVRRGPPRPAARRGSRRCPRSGPAARGDLEQGRLACSVRPDDHPALVAARRPVDVPEQHRPVVSDPDTAQPQHLIRHAAPSRHTTIPARTYGRSIGVGRRLSLQLPDGKQRRLSPVGHAELGQDRADMGLDGLLRYPAASWRFPGWTGRRRAARAPRARGR